MSHLRWFHLGALASLFAATSCGGGSSGPGSSGVVPAPTQTPSRQASSAVVQVVITWPKRSPGSNSGHRAYLSSSTASVTIVVDGGTPTIANDPSLSGSPQSTSVVNVNAPLGSDTFLVGDYDAINGGGNLLAQNSVPFTVGIDKVNTLTVTLNGNLGKIACEPVGPLVYYTSGTSGPFTLVGPAGQVALLPEDADSNIIIAPGAVPTLSLTAATPAQATVTSTSVANEFTANVLVTGTAETLNASGTNLAGNTVTGTCSVTRIEALYVANQGVYGTRSPSVTIYPASASGAATPTATISGTNTDLVQINFVAVDPHGNLFVSNEGPLPGMLFGPASGYVSIYGPGTGQSGNVAPLGTISGIQVPEGLAFDTSNNLYVQLQDRINVYPPAANGVTAAAAPSTTIVGANTGINSQYGLAVDMAGNIYTPGVDDVTSQGQMLIFAAGSKGNATPIIIEPVGSTSAGIPAESESWLGVAVDSASPANFYLTASNNNLNLVVAYAAQTASGQPTPTDLSAPLFSQPIGIFVDIFGNAPTGDFFVANYGNNSVETFTSTTALGTGIASSTLSGTGTGLNKPFGLYVR